MDTEARRPLQHAPEALWRVGGRWVHAHTLVNISIFEQLEVLWTVILFLWLVEAYSCCFVTFLQRKSCIMVTGRLLNRRRTVVSPAGSALR